MEKMISINNINKRYGTNVIFDNFSIDFYENKINCILGKSGCGKSTLLNIISGIIPNDNLSYNELKELGISYIFQEDRLIDWLTVEENIKLVVKNHYSKDEIDKVCDKYLKLVGISEYKKFYPQKLSGGLRQRVNIARSFIFPSKLIIMDEPFKSIDIKNKQIIIENFKKILSEDNRTVLFVTHDIEEALTLADKIYVLGHKPIQIKNIFDKNEELNKETLSKCI